MGETGSLFLYFVIYSFLGWVCETVFCSFLFRKIVNRGFLNGPFCPLYGFGALLLLCLLDGLPRNAALVFAVGMLVTTALEYFTGWLLETLFHARWWDYSQNRLNFRGRICLFNSLLFGLLSVLLVFALQPLSGLLLSAIPGMAKLWLVGILIAYFAADCAVTIASMRKLNLRLEALSKTFMAVKERLDHSNFYTAMNLRERLEKLHEVLDTEPGRALYASIENLKERISQLEFDNRVFQNRIIRAFPDIRSTRYPEILNAVKERISGGKRTARKQIEQRNDLSLIKLCVFDLDGTLVNSLSDLADSTNYALKKNGFAEHETQDYRFMVGDGVPMLIRRALGGDASETAETAVLEDFNAFYDNHYVNHTIPYEGNAELLRALCERSVKCAVLSNKPDDFVKKIIAKLYPDTEFAWIQGKAEGFAKKPDPAALLFILRSLDIPKEHVLYIGDSNVDVFTGKNAGVATCGVTWGFRGREELAKAGADYLVDRPEEILALIK